MNFAKKSLALLLAVAMLAGCTTPATSAPAPSASAPAPSASASAPVSSEAPKTEEYKYGDWKPYDAEGKIKRTDRDGNGANGVVSSGKYEASKIGVEIIEKGGNAIDAAVAVGFAIGVCEPQSSGLGGGGFMTLRLANGETTFVDFREIAPKYTSPAMWVKDAEGKVIGNQKKNGGKAVGVPGEVAGMLYILEKYGTMSRQEVMQPAIDLAENGFEVSAVLNADIKNSFDLISKYDTTAAIYLKDGFPPEVGTIIKNPDLAKTLKAIAADGKDAFYKGSIAKAMVDSVQAAGGLLTLEDLENYEVTVREPAKGTYRGYEIISSPPPSSGGAHIIQMLNIMENFDMSKIEVNSPEYLHIVSECLKMAFADRAKYMADTAFVDVPVKGVESKEYAKTLAAQIDMNASKDYSAGDPWKFNESDDTTHYSIIDKEGNMIAVTKTINGVFASGIVARGTGLIMNNEMDDFDFGSETVNAVEPGKKPLSSMSPTLVVKDGKPVMSIGAPGATKIFGGVFQVISKYIDYGMDIQDAINHPRIHDSYGTLSYENRIDAETIKKLEAMGHKIKDDGEWSGYPVIQAVVMLEDGTLRGGADPRRDGKAVGY